MQHTVCVGNTPASKISCVRIIEFIFLNGAFASTLDDGVEYMHKLDEKITERSTLRCTINEYSRNNTHDKTVQKLGRNMRTMNNKLSADLPQHVAVLLLLFCAKAYCFEANTHKPNFTASTLVLSRKRSLKRVASFPFPI